MLQKLELDRETLFLGVELCSYLKDLMHEFDQFFNGSSLYFFNLTFAHHVDNFVSCDCALEQLDRLSEMGQLVYTNSTIQVIHRL